MKISLVMPTYNGAKFILPMLESVLSQDRQPDEVILRDDCSSDDTYQICQDFVNHNGLQSNWTVLRNQENLGYSENFYALVKQTSGDIFFFADQDDIWLPDKIRVMAKIMEDHPEIDILSCQQEPFEGDAPNVERQVKKPVELSALTQVSLKMILHDFHDSSIQLALRKSFFDDIVERISGSGLPNDWAVCMLAANRGSMWRLDERLVLRRVHSANASGLGVHRAKRRDQKYRTEQIKKNIQMYQQTPKLLDAECPKWLPEMIAQMREIDCERIRIIERGNLMAALWNLLTKRQMVRTPSLLGDINCILFKEKEDMK